MSKMIQPDIRIYQERKQLMRNLKGKTGRNEKTKHSLSTDTHKREKMLGEQGIYVYTQKCGERKSVPPQNLTAQFCAYTSCY
jgi:hypothetical protein